MEEPEKEVAMDYPASKENLLRRIGRFISKFPLGFAFLTGGVVLGALAGVGIFLRFTNVEQIALWSGPIVLLILNGIVGITVALPIVIFYYKLTSYLDLRWNVWRWLDK